MLLGVPLVAVSLPLTWIVLTRFLHPLRGDLFREGREVIAGELEKLGRISRPEATVGFITAATATLWIIRPLLEPWIPGLNDTTIAMGGAFAMFVVPLDRKWTSFGLEWSDIERLPWSVLLLFGGGLALADSIQKSGLAVWIGDALGAVQGWPIFAVALIVTVVIVFLTELTSNTATAATFLPVVGAIALAMRIDPLLLALPVAIGASCAFMMPVATPPNAIVYGSGKISIPQMARAGLVLNLIFIVLILVVLFTIGVPLFDLREVVSSQ